MERGKKTMNFAVIGGDRRMVFLCQGLAEDGHKVRRYGLPEGESSLVSALSGADCIILPLPMCKEPGRIHMPQSEHTVGLQELLRQIAPGQLLCGGRVSQEEADLAASFDLELIDYLQREELAVRNAVSTVEGALEILLEQRMETLWGSRVLVVGFGRIGKLLAHRLKGLGATVWVSSRKYSDMAMTEAMGYGVLDTRALSGWLGAFDVVVNTVPALVLDRELLGEMKQTVYLLDLASAPGGIDLAAAETLGLQGSWALSLPGKCTPAAAGRAIRDTIYHIVKERQYG
jgi:dipicolinate synthase subunit A